MLQERSISFVVLSDVLEYMGYSDLQDDAPDIFSFITWGDSLYTITPLRDVLDTLYVWLDNDTDITWTDNQAKVFGEKAKELDELYTFVDMEN